MQSLHQLLPSRLALLAVLLCTLLPLITSATSPLLVPRTFGAVKSLGGSHLTVFYFGSDAAAAPLLAEVEAAAQTVAAVAAQAASATAMAGLAEWQWATVDCAAAANIADCQEAGFGAGNSWLFTSTPAEGIHAFAGPRTAADIARHVRHKVSPTARDCTQQKSRAPRIACWCRPHLLHTRHSMLVCHADAGTAAPVLLLSPLCCSASSSFPPTLPPCFPSLTSTTFSRAWIWQTHNRPKPCL